LPSHHLVEPGQLVPRVTVEERVSVLVQPAFVVNVAKEETGQVETRGGRLGLLLDLDVVVIVIVVVAVAVVVPDLLVPLRFDLLAFGGGVV
jgi:hypothetical protein